MRKITLPDGRIKVLFQGLEKVDIKEIVNGSPLMGIVDILPTQPYKKDKINAILDILKTNIDKLSKLNTTFPIDLIKTNLKEDLEIMGAVLTMYDKRNQLSHQIIKEVQRHFPGYVFDAIIPRNVSLAEAPSFGKTILQYAPSSAGAKAYDYLAREMIDAET